MGQVDNSTVFIYLCLINYIIFISISCVLSIVLIPLLNVTFYAITVQCREHFTFFFFGMPPSLNMLRIQAGKQEKSNAKSGYCS